MEGTGFESDPNTTKPVQQRRVDHTVSMNRSTLCAVENLYLEQLVLNASSSYALRTLRC
jgi:hypothetical protein